MQHWLTINHSPEKKYEGDPGESGVWVCREHASSFGDLAEGDLALIYRTKSGPKRWLQDPDGSRRRSRYHSGCGGVVSVGRVIKVTPDLPVTRAIQDDGVEIDWARLARLAVKTFSCPVLLATVNEALEWSPRARMRGFGGLLRITKAQFKSIVDSAGA